MDDIRSLSSHGKTCNHSHWGTLPHSLAQSCCGSNWDRSVGLCGTRAASSWNLASCGRTRKAHGHGWYGLLGKMLSWNGIWRKSSRIHISAVAPQGYHCLSARSCKTSRTCLRKIFSLGFWDQKFLVTINRKFWKFPVTSYVVFAPRFRNVPCKKFRETYINESGWGSLHKISSCNCLGGNLALRYCDSPHNALRWGIQCSSLCMDTKNCYICTKDRVAFCPSCHSGKMGTVFGYGHGATYKEMTWKSQCVDE